MEDYIQLDTGAICWHIDKMPFSLEVQQKAERELNESHDNKVVALNLLRNRVQNQSDFVSRMDDNFFLRFLRARKFNVDKAFLLLRNYYKHRESYPHVYDPFRPSEMKDILSKSDLTILPYRDPEGRPIIRIVPGFIGENIPPPHVCTRVYLFCLETIIESEPTQVNGFVILVDWSYMSIGMFRHLMRLSDLIGFLKLLQDCFPARAKTLHVIFENTLADIAYAMVKPFMKKKLKERIIFHGHNLETLHQYLPPAILPKEYGGELTTDPSMLTTMLLSNEENLVNNVVKFGFKKS